MGAAVLHRHKADTATQAHLEALSVAIHYLRDRIVRRSRVSKSYVALLHARQYCRGVDSGMVVRSCAKAIAG